MSFLWTDAAEPSMTYLIVQTFILLLIAGLLGLLLGWYLTRLSAAGVQATLRARVRSAEEAQRELAGARDAATRARDHAESERRLLSDEVGRLHAEYAAARAEIEGLRSELEGGQGQGGMPPEHAALLAELDDCRTALENALAPAAVPGEQEVDSGAIASAAAAAAGAMGLMGLASGVEPPPASAEPDDLQQISGIGPKIAGILHELGVRRFEQIAAWSPEEVRAINAQLRFKGRIEREAWIPQAKALIAARDA
jgi:predicted flap endonuclease-1-like 5' DNA nuclease